MNPRQFEEQKGNSMISSNRTFGKTLMASAVGFALLWTPAAAEQGTRDMSKQQAGEGFTARAVEPIEDAGDEFDERVRQALLRNPEIMLEIFALLEQKEVASKAVKDQDLIASVADDLFAGLDPDKPILVEFQDYNCGYCRKSHATVQALREQMPDLQLVLMEMPILSDGSRYTAQAALALKSLEGEEAYLNFADAIMGGTETANVATVLRVLTDQGHDAEAVVKAIKAGQGADELKKAQDLADALGVTGPPYFVGPSGIIRGAASIERLKGLTTSEETNG